MNEKDAIKLSRTGLIALGAFLALSLIFAFVREPISQFNIWCLAMTGEITITKSKEPELPKAVVVRKEMFKEANKINKVKVPPKPQKNEHLSRTRPAEKGLYIAADTKEPEKATIFVHEKENISLYPQNWHGSDDLSFRCRVTRQATGFNVVVVVKDDILWAQNEQVQHMNDCVEIYFDVRPSNTRGQDEYECGVCHALIVPYFGPPSRANTMTLNFKGKDEKLPAGVWVKSSEIKNFGYRVEAFFPFSMFPNLPEDEFNFDIGVIDYDDKTNYTQMVWSGTKENYRGTMWFGRMKKAQ